MDNDNKDDYYKFIKTNKMIKHTVNGLNRFLILWIIKYNENIHGYGIMKELDKFFENLIKEGALKKSNSSKIYPILKDMEEQNLIIGTVEESDKKVKSYQITNKGKYLLNYVFERFMRHEFNDQWKILLDDLLKE